MLYCRDNLPLFADSQTLWHFVDSQWNPINVWKFGVSLSCKSCHVISPLLSKITINWTLWTFTVIYHFSCQLTFSWFTIEVCVQIGHIDKCFNLTAPAYVQALGYLPKCPAQYFVFVLYRITEQFFLQDFYNLQVTKVFIIVL